MLVPLRSASRPSCDPAHDFTRMPFRAVVVTIVLVMFGIVATASAQVQVQPPEVFVIEGRVAWITAQKMIVAPANDFAVNVDLARIAQSDVRLISQNSYVIVTGHLLRPTRTILAQSIQVISAWYPESP
jgi:hypothetical protein